MPQVYEPEFKRKLVRLHLEEGRSYKSLTQEYGVSKSAISKWVELFSNECQKKVNADPTALNDADLMKENLRLRKRVMFADEHVDLRIEKGSEHDVCISKGFVEHT